MQPVDVLRALALGELCLGPGELESLSRELAVERCLRCGHERSFGALVTGPPSGERDALHAAAAYADRLELDVEPVEVGTAREPGGRREPDATSFSGPIISSGSPYASPRFSFTSATTTRRPRRTTRSSSYRPAWTFAPSSR